MKPILLWGAGVIGARFIRHIGEENVLAFIDSNPKKIGSKYCGKPVISFEEYLQSYRDKYVVITGYYPKEIIDKMKGKSCYRFFWCMDCPGEWLDECERPEFEKTVSNKLGSLSRAIVYGCNYYSIRIAEEILKKTGERPVIAYNKWCDGDFLGQIQKDFAEYDFIQLQNIKEISTICLTEDSRYGFDDEPIDDNVHVIDCWDLSSEIKEYHNKRIEAYRDLHSGKRCFLIGLGPSLNKEDLDVLYENEEICFGVNEIWKFFDATKWRPDYFVSTDTTGITEYKDKYARMDAKAIFISDQIRDADKDYYKENAGEKYYSYHLQRATSINLYPRFATDCSKTLYYGYTVMYACIQFAVYMGFKEIYLLGTDATGSSLGYGFVTYGHAYKESELLSKFTEPYNTHAYMAAKQYAENNGIHIYNATRGGELEVFERVNFDKLFERC